MIGITLEISSLICEHNTEDILSKSVNTHCIYSKTSNNGPSEKRTTSLQRTAHLPPIDFTIELIHYEPPRSGHLNSEQRTLIRPRHTLANTKLPPKTDSEATPT